MQYLNTQECGFDGSSLGFPSVMTCQAIVYQTKEGLFGYHDAYGEAEDFVKKCDAFRGFVQSSSINHQTMAVCLIGVIVQTTRFSKNKKGAGSWEGELEKVASALGFTGPIWRGRLEEGVVKGDSAYIKFDVDDNKTNPPCKVSYRNWADMGFDNNSKVVTSEFTHREIKVSGLDPVQGRLYTTGPAAKMTPKRVVGHGLANEGTLLEFTNLKRAD